MQKIWPHAYALIGFATTIFLTFFDGYHYNAWNWLIAIPANVCLGAIWPAYWGLLRWVT